MILVYITCATLDEAKSIARTAVTEKLAACANIFPQMYSVYNWQEKLCEDNEVVLILKTLESNYEKLSVKVKELHSYECPCIIALDVKQANNEYLDWISKQVT